MAELMDLPEEVVESGILPHLQWNDLLRCRRVCKSLKYTTDNYVRVHPELAPVIEIDDTDTTKERSVSEFLSLGIPTTKLFINNPTGDEFFSRNATALTSLLETYGPIIQSLQLQQLSLYPCFEEWNFLEALTSLKTLEAGFLGFGIPPSPTELPRVSQAKLARARKDPRFGENFMPHQILQSLETVKIGQNKEYLIANINDRIGKILIEAQYLKYLKFPFSSKYGTVPGPDEDLTRPLPPPDLIRPHSVLAIVFEYISKTITHRYNVGGQGQNLEYFDFANYHGEFGEGIAEMHWVGSPAFLELCAKCCSHGVKLKNICPIWFFRRVSFPAFENSELGRCVVSMVNLHPCVFPVNMPNLEKLDIRETSRSHVNDSWREGRPEWPKLKRMDIGVDCVSVRCSEDGDFQPTAMLFKFLWRDVRREMMTEINLVFGRRCDSCEKHVGGEVVVAVPRLEEIGRSCPNLKKIGIWNWPGTNNALVKLWRGLRGSLEEVVMGYCKELGNVGFVGEDKENPVFLKMTKLKKLTLVGLDRMPKITDTLFRVVLAKMKLSQLLLDSDKPLEKVTKSGIQALLQGPFAQSIEKFPFDEWSLANVTSEEFRQLEKKFRSYDML